MLIRQAVASDVDLLVAFIAKKAAFDRAVGGYTGELRTSAVALHRTMFGTPAFASALLAEDAAVAVGFALYYFRFSSFAARPSLWLDDLYVDASHRGRGVGKLLMGRLATVAAGFDCTHLAWTADDRNEQGMRFYGRIGATRVEQQGHSVTWQIDSGRLQCT